jgi:ribose transport system ATP-binding protein
VVALHLDEFDLRSGEIHALLGENGAGKSTLVKCVTGALIPDGGTIAIRGEPVHLRGTADAAAAGIAAVYQELSLVPDLTVARNVLLGREPLHQGRLTRLVRIVDRAQLISRARAALSLFGLADEANRRLGSLSIARRQLVEIARAVSSNAQILLLDEPTSSLTPAERDQLFAHLRRLARTGVGIIYISHRLDETVSIADRCTVLRDGRKAGTLLADDLNPDRMIRLMTGSATGWSDDKASAPTVAEQVVLELRELTRRPYFESISFKVHRGEVVGLAGLVGAGRTELLRAVFGADSRDGGEVLVEGRETPVDSPATAIAAGISLVTEDRHATGIIPMATVAANISIAALNARRASDHVRQRFGVYSPRALLRLAAESMTELGIRARSPRQEMRLLSGGNQQKAIVARWLHVKPKVLLLDDPTRGISVNSKREIHRLIRELAREGVAVVVVSSDFTEVLTLVDRILVLRRGRIVLDVPSDQTDEGRILRHAAVG